MATQDGFTPDESIHDGLKRFRFKAHHSRSASQDEEPRKKRHHESPRHSRRKRHKIDLDAHESEGRGSSSFNSLHPDDAFRESLFDALGDDEGAAFWQGIYGQPIHDYQRSYVNQDTGELEQLDDEEYAQYVRRKMWEKSTEGIEAAKEEHRRKRAEQRRVREHERHESRQHRGQTTEDTGPDFLFDLEVDASLRRGRARKESRRWKHLWEDYLKRWDDLQQLIVMQKDSSSESELYLRNKIPWPVSTTKRSDVDFERVKEFMNHAQLNTEQDVMDDKTQSSMLKAERIRWHPDKIQQKYGFMNIDERTMNTVTAVFQILDRLWSERKDKSKT